MQFSKVNKVRARSSFANRKPRRKCVKLRPIAKWKLKKY